MEDVARQHQYPVAAARLRDNAGGEVLETFECLAIQSALRQDVLVWTPGPAKNPGKRMRPSRFRGAVFGMYAVLQSRELGMHWNATSSGCSLVFWRASSVTRLASCDALETLSISSSMKSLVTCPNKYKAVLILMPFRGHPEGRRLAAAAMVASLHPTSATLPAAVPATPPGCCRHVHLGDSMM